MLQFDYLLERREPRVAMVSVFMRGELERAEARGKERGMGGRKMAGADYFTVAALTPLLLRETQPMT